MSLVDASLLIVSGFFGLFGLAAAVEYGIVLKMLASDDASRRMFTPLLGVSTVPLAFSLTALAILFNGVLSYIDRGLRALIIIAVVTLTLRAAIILSVVYTRSAKKVPAWLLWFFGFLTMLTPLVLASVGVYFLCGQMFWHSLVGIVLMVASFVGLAAVGLSVADRRLPAARQLSAQLVSVVWLLLMGSALPIVALHSPNNLSPASLAVLALLAAGSLGLMLVNFINRPIVKLWPVLSVLCFFAPITLAWSARPYLISGRLTLAQAYGSSSHGPPVVIGLVVLSSVVLFCLYWFLKQMPSATSISKRSKS